MLSPAAFKAYDVRGIVPDELDADGAYALARGYVSAFEPRVMAIGRDMRLSSPDLAAAAVRGAADAGANVVDLGQIGTELLYFAVGEYGYEGGLQVTASHNPAAYNGMKIVRRGALPVGADTGLDKIKEAALGDLGQPSGSPGEVTRRDVYGGFHDRVAGFVDASAVRPLRIVLDGCNGMAGPMIGPVLDRLPVQVSAHNFEPDGHFPTHEPNPLLEENRRFIIERVRAEGADLGIAWDGDADRCFFIDGDGEFVPGDFLTALLAASVLEKAPGADILYDVRASRAVPDTIARHGGRALVNRVGHAFFKTRMRDEGGEFGGEVSGHYYFRAFYNADSGTIPALLILELLSKRNTTL